ncbi:hypothetical protein [Croceitalea marina]|uniref:hypothetical protein n=1 Tax=Croceitalea marina TaxID=1775166 RepID=UPI003672C5BB
MSKVAMLEFKVDSCEFMAKMFLFRMTNWEFAAASVTGIWQKAKTGKMQVQKNSIL